MDLVKLKSFDGKLPFLTYKGKLAAPCKALGLVMEYEQEGHGLVHLVISQPKEFKVGHHYVVLIGKELKDFKQLDSLGEFCSPSAPKLMLLLEPGINRALVLTKKDIGLKVRDFLDTEVMPQITKTGAYISKTLPKPSKLLKPAPAVPPGLTSALHEFRMGMEAARKNGTLSLDLKSKLGQRLNYLLLQYPVGEVTLPMVVQTPQQLTLADAPKPPPEINSPWKSEAARRPWFPPVDYRPEWNWKKHWLKPDVFHLVYDFYTGSYEWKARSGEYVEVHPDCELCAAKGVLRPTQHVHHRSYENLKQHGIEDPADLQALCLNCHLEIHAHMQPTVFTTAAPVQEKFGFMKPATPAVDRF